MHLKDWRENSITHRYHIMAQDIGISPAYLSVIANNKTLIRKKLALKIVDYTKGEVQLEDLPVRPDRVCAKCKQKLPESHD